MRLGGTFINLRLIWFKFIHCGSIKAKLVMSKNYHRACMLVELPRIRFKSLATVSNPASLRDFIMVSQVLG